MIRQFAGSLMAIFWWAGVFRGLFERGKRKSAHNVAAHNQSKLDEWVLKEFDGGDVTHKDAEANMLVLQNVGADLIDFSVKGRKVISSKSNSLSNNLKAVPNQLLNVRLEPYADINGVVQLEQVRKVFLFANCPDRLCKRWR